MKTIKLILNSINTGLYVLMTTIGAITFLNSILSHDFWKYVTNVSTWTIICGAILGFVCNFIYVANKLYTVNKGDNK
jgi:hypothetical protein